MALATGELDGLPGSGLQISFLALRMSRDVDWKSNVGSESGVICGAKNEI